VWQGREQMMTRRRWTGQVGGEEVEVRASGRDSTCALALPHPRVGEEKGRVIVWVGGRVRAWSWLRPRVAVVVGHIAYPYPHPHPHRASRG
jgi:hypothetical protein